MQHGSSQGQPQARHSAWRGGQGWSLTVITLVGHLCPFTHLMLSTEPTLLLLLSPHLNILLRCQFMAHLVQEAFPNLLAHLSIPALTSDLHQGYVCV